MKFRQTTVLFLSLRYTKIVFLRNTRRHYILQEIDSSLRANGGSNGHAFPLLDTHVLISQNVFINQF